MTTQAENIMQALQLAVSHHQAGRLKEAEIIYKQVLIAEPDNEHANHFLGIIATQSGNDELAVQLISKAIAKNPVEPSYLINLGNVYQNQNNLDKAAESYKKALAIKPGFPDAEYNIGTIYFRQERLDEAVASFTKALELQPDYIIAMNGLGAALQKQGKIEEAKEQYARVLAINPDNAETLNKLGGILQEQGSLDAALAHFEKALAANPNLVEAHSNMGRVFYDRGQLREAEAALCRGIAINPYNAGALNNLGIVLKDRGELTQALENFKKTLNFKPDHYIANSNLLLTLNYMSAISQEEIYNESRKWEERHAKRFMPVEPGHGNSPEKGRRLRVGYISPDFKVHSVASFFEPVIRAHDRNNVEVFCYANVRKADASTGRIQAAADHWTSIVGKLDAEIVNLVKKDTIDILVDLAGHTADNNLLVFARKPAPVQVTWIGYPNTTGMSAMDYRLTDAIVDPAGSADTFSSEKLVRLEHGFLCYQADGSAPAVTQPPCLENGYITFGSFNNLPKITPEVVTVWAQILHTVPGSRLLLKAKQLADTEVVKQYRDMFAKEGIAPERLEFYGTIPSKQEHLGFYARMDIGLDPFPYNGTTTTCEALWMGVPVLTLSGDRHSCRVGASILHQAGLDDLVVRSTEEYIKTAQALASDLDSLREMRSSLREIMQDSSLMDSKSFVKDLEDAYRQMWHTWCEHRKQKQ